MSTLKKTPRRPLDGSDILLISMFVIPMIGWICFIQFGFRKQPDLFIGFMAGLIWSITFRSLFLDQQEVRIKALIFFVGLINITYLALAFDNYFAIHAWLTGFATWLYMHDVLLKAIKTTRKTILNTSGLLALVILNYLSGTADHLWVIPIIAMVTGAVALWAIPNRFWGLIYLVLCTITAFIGSFEYKPFLVWSLGIVSILGLFLSIKLFKHDFEKS